jgi:hypothetical protein
MISKNGAHLRVQQLSGCPLRHQRSRRPPQRYPMGPRNQIDRRTLAKAVEEVTSSSPLAGYQNLTQVQRRSVPWLDPAREQCPASAGLHPVHSGRDHRVKLN